MDALTLEQHIVSTPGTLGGRPRIAGHRISVSHVAIWHEQMGMGVAEIADAYGLSFGEIYAALSYYHDHKQEIDDRIAEDERFYQEMKRQSQQNGKGAM